MVITHDARVPASGHGHRDDDALASTLAPVLVQACQGRLSTPTWFRAAWQASGSATGYARYRLDDGREVEAVVKLPVTPAEYRWTTGRGLADSDGLGESHPQMDDDSDACTPRVLAAGTELGGYDLAWLVIEKLEGSPLNRSLDQAAVEDLLRAATRWYLRAASIKPTTEPLKVKDEDWSSLIGKAREHVKVSGMADGQRWNDLLRQTQRVLPGLVASWQGRPINTWCHGDLHPGNAMRRGGHRPGDATHGCVLIDLALVHAGHWVEDAAYLERLYWGKPELLHGVKPVSFMAGILRETGRLGGEDYTRLAHVRRVLMAASVPAFLEHEGHPRYVRAALEVLEKSLGLV
jgi:Phosphotransferase enzyme family